MRFLVPLLVLLWAGLATGASAAGGPSLVMVEQPGCLYCARWHEEIGPAYPKTEIGARLGLTQVQLSEVTKAPFRTARPVVFTPTFLLVLDGAEIGRLEGYPGAHFFWPLLEGMVDKARIATDG